MNAPATRGVIRPRDRILRPGDVVAAAFVIGGVVTLLLPQYAFNVFRLIVVTAAAAVCVYALAVNVPVTWSSPFDRSVRRWPRSEVPDTVRWIRSRFWSRRQPVPRGPALPPEVLRMLQPLIRAAIGQDDPLTPDPRHEARFRGSMSGLTWAVLRAQPLTRSLWYRTLWPNPKQVAKTVHAVLDDLDRLAASGPAPQYSPEPEVHT